MIQPGEALVEIGAIERERDTGHQWRERLVAPTQLAYMLYSSGSTGRTKGIMIERANLSAFARALRTRLKLSAEDRWLQLATPSFDVFIEEVFPTLTSGGTVLCRPDMAMPDFLSLQRLLTRTNATIVELSTQYWYEYQRWLEGCQLAPPASLRLLIVGGEHMDSECYRHWQARYATKLVHVYGITETSVSSTLFEGRIGIAEQEVPLGTALDHNRIELRGDRAGASEEGEIFISGAAVGRGYWRDPGLTAARFRPDPSGPPGSRTFATGDRAAFSASHALVFRGRYDDQVKLHGRRLELGEVERVLRDVPFVEQAAVILVPEPRPALAVFVVCRGSKPSDRGRAVPLGEPERTTLFTTIGRKLPSWAHPVQVFAVAEMPRTDRGKIDRGALRRMQKEERQSATAEDHAGDVVLESVLRAFRGALEKPDLAVDDDFFDCGGDSLRALALVSLLASLGRETLSVATIFDAPTPRQLAEHLRGGAMAQTCP
jgi:acyl-coenzyme A synthetase/AMP-(fatty) acid ligase